MYKLIIIIISLLICLSMSNNLYAQINADTSIIDTVSNNNGTILYFNVIVPENASIDTTIIKVNFANQIDTTSTEETSGQRLLQSFLGKLDDILAAIVVFVLVYLIIKIVTQLLDVLSNRSTKYRLTLKKFIPISA